MTVEELLTEMGNTRGEQSFFVIALVQVTNNFDVRAGRCPVGSFWGGIWVYSCVGNSEERDPLDMCVWESAVCK